MRRARFITPTEKRRLVANGRWNTTRRARGEPVADLRPLVKLRCPWSGACWLVSELDPKDTDLAFGLYHSSTGLGELGRFRLSDLASIRGPGGLRIERDRRFRPTGSLRAYAAVLWSVVR